MPRSRRLLLILAVIGGCATPPPPFAGEYALVSVNDSVPPVVIAEADGATHEVMAGRITLNADRTYHDTLITRTTDAAGSRIGGTGDHGTYGFFGSDTIVFDSAHGTRRLAAFGANLIVRDSGDTRFRYVKR